VEFEPKIRVFERAETVQALDSGTIVMSTKYY
jgi:hypothetical protein